MKFTLLVKLLVLSLIACTTFSKNTEKKQFQLGGFPNPEHILTHVGVNHITIIYFIIK